MEIVVIFREEREYSLYFYGYVCETVSSISTVQIYLPWMDEFSRLNHISDLSFSYFPNRQKTDKWKRRIQIEL